MNTVRNVKYSEFFVALAFLILSLIILNRWLFVELGYASFGRIWYYHVSYSDIGFTRRVLIGTIVELLGIRERFSNPYYIALVVYGFALIILGALSLLLLKRSNLRGDARPLIVLLFFASPAYLLHFGYSSGNTDIYALIVALIIILTKPNPLLFFTLSAIGISFHEIYVFLMPYLIVVLVISRKLSPKDAASYFTDRAFIAPLFVFCVFGIFLLFQTPSLSPNDYEGLMAERLSYAVGAHPFWSGSFETGAAVSSHWEIVKETFIKLSWAQVFGLIIGFTYLAGLYRVMSSAIVLNSFHLFLLRAGILFPLISMATFNEFFRALSLSCTLILFSLLLFSANLRRAGLVCYFVLIFGFALGPFGNIVERPFPVLQLSLEKAKLIN